MSWRASKTPPDASSPRMSSDTCPFVLLGAVDRIDVAERRIGVAGQALRALVSISVEGVRVGQRAVVTGLREPAAAEATAVSVIPLGRTSPCRTLAPPEGRTLVPLVVMLLLELASEIQALECRLLPISDRYAVRLGIPGEPGKEVFLPRLLLERADTGPVARRAAADLLSAAARVLGGRRPVDDSWRAAGADSLAAPGRFATPRCRRCARPVAHDDAILVEADRPRHLVCSSFSSGARRLAARSRSYLASPASR
jgi:hypothetical protein